MKLESKIKWRWAGLTCKGLWPREWNEPTQGPVQAPFSSLKLGSRVRVSSYFMIHFASIILNFVFVFLNLQCLNILSLDFVELPTNFEENKKGTFEKPKCEENEKNKNHYSTSVIQISIILLPSRDEKHLLERCRMRFNESCQTYPKRHRLKKWERERGRKGG